MSETKEECEGVTSTKGRIKLYKNGFTYENCAKISDKYYWYCELRRDKVNHGSHIVQKSSDNHNHGPNPSRKPVRDFIENMKKAAESEMKVCKIIQTSKASVPSSVVECLPSTSALKQTIYRHRRKKDVVKEPNDIFFKINESLTSFDGENFVIKDCIFEENKRVILMSTLNLMTILSKSTYWILDGTFKVAPSLFTQLYTIHGNIFSDNTKTFPLCFCLSTNKDKRTYDVMSELIAQYGQEHNLIMAPKVCILDFEKASILSLRSNFENITLHGCLFHLGQIIYRQVQAQACAKKYASSMTFNKQVKCLLALSYLPEEEIPTYFNTLLRCIEDPDWKALALWFQENYISGTRNTQPKYAPNYWSCHNINKMKIPRTSNSAEAWHHKINIIIDKNHPGVYSLINTLMKESLANTGDIEAILSGAPSQRKKKNYSNKDERIDTILQHKEEYSEFKLLMCIATNLKI
ncbi:hypothetical protein ABMA27_016160 [Loxostege sticticalis]|uniref:MULE transposase domain-containing protein n=1 Tax=Loxostege sticticalis TaxID=481309 RepID=A0ABR3I5R3_LOXSC